VAVQSSTFTVADALKLICRLRRTMHLEELPCPRTFNRPLAVWREDIIKLLAEDKGRTDLMDLDNRLYKHHSVKVKSSRAVDGLHDRAATFICLIQDHPGRRFFNHADASKNRLSNDAVLAATIVTPGGAAMLLKAASRAGQDDPIGRARAALLTTAERLSDGDAEEESRQQELERERKRCRMTQVDWESDASRAADAVSPAEIVMQELERFVAMHATATEVGAVDFWSAHANVYPHLQIVACAVLGAAGSSAASERDVSVAGMVLRKDRASLLPSHVEMHGLIRFKALLVPSDLSAIPVLTQAARSSARADMRPISVDLAGNGGSSGDSSLSDGDTVLEPLDEDEGVFF